jgi:hypothetical protein
MFGFNRKSGKQSSSAAIIRALEGDGLPPGMDAVSALGVVQSRGSYAGRTVTYLRAYDRARAAERGLEVQTLGDLDTHPDLVLRTGHVEQDGSVVITWRAPSPDAATPMRAQADRALHDDARWVFPGEGG